MSLKSKQRANLTLSFEKPGDRGPVMETFYPWSLTVDAWGKQGLPGELADMYEKKGEKEPADMFLDCTRTSDFYGFEKYFGFDSVKRIFFNLPFSQQDSELLEETDEYKTVRDKDGWTRKYYKDRDMVKDVKPAVSCKADWDLLKAMAVKNLDLYYGDENIKLKYGGYSEDAESSARLAIPGFFWAPRDLMGIAEHMMSFYDKPELLHEINDFILDVYLDRLSAVLDTVSVDILYIMEDLSGKNGPMLAPAHFDEFVGAYYRKLVPFVKSHGGKTCICGHRRRFLGADTQSSGLRDRGISADGCERRDGYRKAQGEVSEDKAYRRVQQTCAGARQRGYRQGA